jgi:hypothetical protein
MTTMCQPWNYLIITPNILVLEHSWFFKIILDTKMPDNLLPLSHPTPCSPHLINISVKCLQRKYMIMHNNLLNSYCITQKSSLRTPFDAHLHNLPAKKTKTEAIQIGIKNELKLLYMRHVQLKPACSTAAGVQMAQLQI